MRAVQEARFDDIEHVPPTDPAEAEAMLKAEEEAHRVGAIGASADAAELLKAIDALRVAASANGGGEGDVAAAALAAAADAEKATWRRATAAAVAQRRVARLRAESRAWRAALEDERKASREAGRTWKRIKGDLEVARDEALEAFRRERATGGVRASLAEEAAELARDEARTARKDAADAFRARDAATGASAGALREARDEAAKLRLRESHWVGLIGCHRESSRVSRELAELATLHGGESARLAVDAAAGPGAELARRRAAAEAEAESHVEAVKAIADMIDVRDRLKEPLMRSSSAERWTEPKQPRRPSTPPATGSTPSPRKRPISRSRRSDTSCARRRNPPSERERRGAPRASPRSCRGSPTNQPVNQRRASEEMAAAREELARLREALDDRDAALGAGAELVERDPELARTVSEGKAALDEAARDAKAAVDGIPRVGYEGAGCGCSGVRVHAQARVLRVRQPRGLARLDAVAQGRTERDSRRRRGCERRDAGNNQGDHREPRRRRSRSRRRDAGARVPEGRIPWGWRRGTSTHFSWTRPRSYRRDRTGHPWDTAAKAASPRMTF
jgi:hypothetical protein